MDKLKRIKDLEAELKDHNIAYYNNDAPKISDAAYDELRQEFDKLVQEISQQGKEFQSDLLTNVGAPISATFKKVKHKKPMLSLANAFSQEDIIDFIARVKRFLGLDNKDNNDLFSRHAKDQQLNLFCEPKIDGLSFCATYKKGKFIQAATRGDGLVGEDITNNIAVISDFPLELKIANPPDILEVRGEVYMSKQDFADLNKNQEKISGKIFANPRNAASGSLRQLDSNITKERKLSYFAYGLGEFIAGSYQPFTSQSQMISQFKKMGFKTEPHSKLCQDISQLMSLYNEIVNNRYQLPYDLDGMVYKIDNLSLQQRLGFVARSPRWAIAHKFPAQKSKTQIKDIIVQIGRTGALTPVAILKPVNIGGVMVTRATLHNKDEIEKKDIRINDVVLIQRAGDVIPQVLEVDFSKRSTDTQKFQFPKYCPSCGSEVKKTDDDVVLRCLNHSNCEAQIRESLKHFVSKDAFDIEGLGKKQIDNFFDEGRIKNFSDIFLLPETEKNSQNPILSKEGWQEKSVNNLFSAINNKKTIELHRFIYALGIRYIGQTTAKLIANNYLSFSNFRKKILEIIEIAQEQRSENQAYLELVNIDGMGSKMAQALIEYFENNSNVSNIDALTKHLNILQTDLSNFSSKLAGKRFLFTGTLKHLSRAEAKERCEKLGIKVVSSISAKTDYLVAGENPGSKIKKAHDLGIKILSEDEWLAMIKN